MAQVLIVGGGFAGINAAKVLASHSDLDIVLLDRRNHHLFQPLLYQVATAGLSPGEIATPIRTILAPYKNIKVFLSEAKTMDLSQHIVHTDMGEFSYDYLILACGSQHSYFGHEEWEPYAPGLKTIEQATEIRRRILTAFEMAERETDPEKTKRLLTFVIIGGGPTGVELAGTLGEISRFTLSKDFRKIDPRHTRILLIEAGPRILPSFDERLSHQAMLDLENLGVTVWTQTRVTKVSAEGVTLNSEAVSSATVLWAAGVQPSPLNATLGVPLDRVGRVIVGPDLSVPGHPKVFVIGDQACVTENSHPLPGLAPVAMQEGRAVAKTILADLRNEKRRPFHYVDKGQMATIGRRKAVAQFRSFRISGLLAWYAWLMVHVYYLVGFRNRIIVLFSWFWSYITFKRGAQLITNKEWRSFPRP